MFGNLPRGTEGTQVEKSLRGIMLTHTHTHTRSHTYRHTWHTRSHTYRHTWHIHTHTHTHIDWRAMFTADVSKIFCRITSLDALSNFWSVMTQVVGCCVRMGGARDEIWQQLVAQLLNIDISMPITLVHSHSKSFCNWIIRIYDAGFYLGILYHCIAGIAL